MDKAADLLLRAQAFGRRGVPLADLQVAWAVDASTVRRVVTRLTKLVEERYSGLGRLTRPHVAAATGKAIRGREARLIWEPRRTQRDIVLFQAVLTRLACLPFARASVGFFDSAIAPWMGDLGHHDQHRLEEISRRGLWYQPAVRRELNEDVVNECTTAVIRRERLAVGEYAPGTGGLRRDLVFEPWTLVHSYDGLYVLGRNAEPAPDRRRRILAVHRMSEVRWLRGEAFDLPPDYDPAVHLGHGFGPFMGRDGTTRLLVPAREWRYVREMVIPREKERQEVELGMELLLDTGFNFGLHRWCLWQGIVILESTDMPAEERAEHELRGRSVAARHEALSDSSEETG